MLLMDKIPFIHEIKQINSEGRIREPDFLYGLIISLLFSIIPFENKAHIYNKSDVTFKKVVSTSFIHAQKIISHF